MAVMINQTVVGNIGRVYDKRTVGKDNNSVIEFSVCATRRARDAQSGEWKDKEPYWITCTAWGRLADNIEESFRPGDHVFVVGRIEMSDPFEGKDGVTREARAKLTAEVAGLEISSFPAASKREAKKAENAGSSTSSSASKPAAKKEAPKKDEDEFNFDDLDF